MDFVYVVNAVWSYEGSAPLRAFADKTAADACADACHEYQKSKPCCPEVDSTSENDVEWEAWSAADDAWRAAHPGGDDAASADYYAVAEVPFSAAAAPPEGKEK